MNETIKEIIQKGQKVFTMACLPFRKNKSVFLKKVKTRKGVTLFY